MTDDFDATVDLRLAYSRSTPRVEIVRSLPGTVWTPAAASGIHHPGSWPDDVADDVADDAAALQRHGHVAEALGR